MSSYRLPPPGGVARWVQAAIAAVAGTALVVLAFFFAVFAIAAGLLLATVIAARWWWRARRRADTPADTAVEGEYRVIARDEIEQRGGDDRRP